MKLICCCSALDLSYRYGCTPAWWQLFKGFHELGHDVIAIAYQGTSIVSPWWRAYPNPCQWEGKAYSVAKELFRGGPTSIEHGVGSKVSKALIDNWVRPRWEGHLRSILQQENDADAVIFFGIPVNHLTGIAERVRARYNVPFYFYDGDVPASLPRFGGFSSGFKIYEGANLREYDGVFCNSEGGAEDLKNLGAQSVTVVHWGVDPEVYGPLKVAQDRDVFFYGYGVEYREEALDFMLYGPSREMKDVTFHLGGHGFRGDTGRAKSIGDVPLNMLWHACCRSRINLNITRTPHASTYASSSLRLFELAAMGCAIVSNPVEGLERWFTPGEEILIVNDRDEAIATYRRLLEDEGLRESLGTKARARVIAQHTHRQRAQEIVDALAGGGK